MTFDVWKEKLIEKNQDYKHMSEQSLIEMYKNQPKKNQLELFISQKQHFQNGKKSF